MILGTHNSGTGGRLVWWLRPFAWFINPTSKCQSRTIRQQLEDGVRLFNFQVAKYKGKYRFSHGLALYEGDAMGEILSVVSHATKDSPIYFQIYLDNSFWCKRDEQEFYNFKAVTKRLGALCRMNGNAYMMAPWIEGTNVRFPGNDFYLRWQEHYWTLGWAKTCALKWIDRLPLPKCHAKKYNAKYKAECNTDYLMLDFYEL